MMAYIDMVTMRLYEKYTEYLIQKTYLNKK